MNRRSFLGSLAKGAAVAAAVVHAPAVVKAANIMRVRPITAGDGKFHWDVWDGDLITGEFGRYEGFRIVEGTMTCVEGTWARGGGPLYAEQLSKELRRAAMPPLALLNFLGVPQ